MKSKIWITNKTKIRNRMWMKSRTRMRTKNKRGMFLGVCL